MARRLWTTREDAVVRQHYKQIPAERIARKLGRSLKSVYLRARQLGLAIPLHRMTDADLAAIRKLAAAGLCHRCIGREIGFERHAVADWRMRLDLPAYHHRTCPRCRQAVAKKTRQQCQQRGVRSLAEIRSQEFARYAAACGWPADLRPRAVQMLNTLWQRGPMTRRELADAIGMPWKGSRKSLVSNDPEGSYLAHLIARGLVASLGRIVRGDGKGRSVYLYSIAPGVEPSLKTEH